MSNSHINRLPPKMILWGGTGQAKVVRPIIEHWGSRVVAVFDDTPGLTSPFSDVQIFCGFEAFLRWKVDQKVNELGFCVAIGNPHGRARLKLHDRLCGEGLVPVTLAHPSAVIDQNATVGIGCQILAGAIIVAEARVGNECIINTGASVDHEDVLEDGTEIGPGAVLCGNVRVKKGAWVCAGATVLPRLTIGEDALVGAGAVVIRDVGAGETVVGVPALRVLEKRKSRL
jgi:sugar O-acyltransferase (sialic acid O-acetyltransferase NeuD family)